MKTAGHRQVRWTNPSARGLGADPVAEVLSRARALVFDAREAGWDGPPFDPFELADLRKVPVVPLEEVEEARLVHHHRKPRIEFNPNRAPERVRFSVAHELAHLLFADAPEETRHRAHGVSARSDDWQLELLCNLAAAEILMPTGSFPELEDIGLDINRLMKLRQEFKVSPESTLLRAVRQTGEPAAVFASARVNATEPKYRVDYVVGSRAWKPPLERGDLLADGPLAECTAVGFTAKGETEIAGKRSRLECVGVPPYPGSRYPRVIGVLQAADSRARQPEVTYVHGDATEPRGSGVRIIAHVVNDKTPNWGGRGFAPALRRAFPSSQEEFRQWAKNQGGLELGQSHIAEVDPDLYVCSMVAQRGYGERTARIPLRYGALDACLADLGRYAAELHATVHLPMIGTGQAGGDWGVISELLKTRVLALAEGTTVYVLPGAALPEEQEHQLALSV